MIVATTPLDFAGVGDFLEEGFEERGLARTIEANEG